MLKSFVSLLLAALFITSCAPDQNQSSNIDWETVQDSSHIAFTVTGLDGPEAVRYDPDQQVYFIS
ncbi:MAG TPA: hypothetical protein DEG32_03450, partial [Balneolaceae bacterium]|nr:hypothetical protein [Balneolaceae bacterium]